jgi:hypothetical protein
MATEAALTIDIRPSEAGPWRVHAGSTDTTRLNCSRTRCRLLVQTLIKWTPPKTQKAGRETVRRDVLKMAQHAYDEHYDLLQLKRDAASVERMGMSIAGGTVSSSRFRFQR